jgi:hypothetical protein
MGMPTTTVENQPIASLTVDVFDANTKKLIYRASGSNVLSRHEDKNDKKDGSCRRSIPGAH